MKNGFETYNRDIIDCLDSAVLFTDWLSKTKIKFLLLKILIIIIDYI